MVMDLKIQTAEKKMFEQMNGAWNHSISEKNVQSIMNHCFDVYDKHFEKEKATYTINNTLLREESNKKTWIDKINYGVGPKNTFYDSIHQNDDLTTLRRVSLLYQPPFYMHNSEKIINWVTNMPGEQFVTSVFIKGIEKDMVCNDGSVVLDIGANAGFYGLLASALGCNVIFFEPQTQCVFRILQAIRANEFSDHAIIVPHGVSSLNDSYIPVSNETACEGRFPINEIEKGSLGDHLDTVFVPNVKIRNVMEKLPEINFALVKVDTEGHELYILQDLLPYFEQNKIKQAVVEITPKFWVLLDIERKEVAEVVGKIWDFGYRFRTRKKVFAQRSDVYQWVLRDQFVQEDLHIFLPKSVSN